MVSKLFYNLMTLRHPKRLRSIDPSNVAMMNTLVQQTASLPSLLGRQVVPRDDSDPLGDCPPTLSQRPSTATDSNLLTSSPPRWQHTPPLLFDPSDVLDIRPTHDNAIMATDLAGDRPKLPSTLTPPPTPLGRPPSYRLIDDSPPPRYILMAPIYETLIPGQEATALLRVLREEQVAELKAGHGFAGFDAEELERWADLVD